MNRKNIQVGDLVEISFFKRKIGIVIKKEKNGWWMSIRYFDKKDVERVKYFENWYLRKL